MLAAAMAAGCGGSGGEVTTSPVSTSDTARSEKAAAEAKAADEANKRAEEKALPKGLQGLEKP